MPRSNIDPDLVATEIQQLQVDGCMVRLPQVRLTQYPSIKRLLEANGGVYVGGKSAFRFPPETDLKELLGALGAGEVRNSKKTTQAFYTPAGLASSVCEAAGPLKDKRTLEPSAGRAALATPARASGADVVVVESDPGSASYLRSLGFEVVERDFLTVTPDELGLFDAIVANPPFTRNADVQHIQHMWRFLKPGGVLSTIASTAWQHGRQKVQCAFRSFLEEHGATLRDIPTGTFQESGTSVATVHITLSKPEAPRPVVAAVRTSAQQDRKRATEQFELF